jgi:lysophospholipase L1-like esterase
MLRASAVRLLPRPQIPPTDAPLAIFPSWEAVMVRSFRTSLLLVCLVVVMASTAMPSEPSPRPFLALGDSVVFGFINNAGFEYVNPANFIGYPDYAGRALKLTDFNAACPGETTGSFLSASAPDNGCRFFRSLAPLHVPYSGTQSSFASTFLATHRQTRLVTVMLGANDVELLETACTGDPTCIANGLPQVLAVVTQNMATILGVIRGTGYKGLIIVENYYSLDYTNPTATETTVLLNQAVTAPAATFGAVVADVFSAFQSAVSNSFAGGNTCRAGLLNASAANQFTCDTHPSQSGQQLIAQAVESAYVAAIRAQSE